MKSAYELAMERLQKDDPDAVVSLSDEQKEEISEIDRRYTAKIAEREIFLQKQLSEAVAKGEMDAVEQLYQQIKNEKARLEEEMEAKKDKVRRSAKQSAD